MKKLLTIFLILTLTFITLSACSNNDNESPNGATVEDETSFTVPEAGTGLMGSWTSKGDEITINRYFYGNGLTVTIEQDPENDTWVFLGLWNDDEDRVTIKNRENYKYDSSEEEWVKSEDSQEDNVLSSDYNEKEDPDRLELNEVLPNGVTANFIYERGSADIELPDPVEIIAIINSYLEQ